MSTRLAQFVCVLFFLIIRIQTPGNEAKGISLARFTQGEGDRSSFADSFGSKQPLSEIPLPLLSERH